MGSFYTSLLAHLLVKGTGRAVLSNRSPKVYIPNTGKDPEERGLSLAGAVEKLADYVLRDATEGEEGLSPLDLVLLDLSSGAYAGKIDEARIRDLGVTIADLPMVTPSSRPYLDPSRVSRVLLSLA